MITLFWCPQTRASRLLWMLGELDEPFETRFVDIRDPDTISDEDFRKASPMGKVPALMDTAPNGTAATYTAAGHVRRALDAAGLKTTRIAGFGRKRHMTIARKAG
jgi:tRNA U34 5-methylaminomethyl-2-thiouridine-forming methyltransferase MnmC